MLATLVHDSWTGRAFSSVAHLVQHMSGILSAMALTTLGKKISHISNLDGQEQGIIDKTFRMKYKLYSNPVDPHELTNTKLTVSLIPDVLNQVSN